MGTSLGVVGGGGVGGAHKGDQNQWWNKGEVLKVTCFLLIDKTLSKTSTTYKLKCGFNLFMVFKISF